MAMPARAWRLPGKEHAHLYAFVGALWLVGAVFGSLLVNALTLDQQQQLAEELAVYLTSLERPETMDAAAAFRDRFLFYARWLGLIWLLGLSVVGLPGVFALNFLKGVLIGFAVGLFVREMAWKGMLFSLAAMAPHNALAVPALMIASVSAIRFAQYVVRECLFRKRGRLLLPFRAHTAATLAMLAVLGCAALLEAYVSPVLLGRLAVWVR